jgi:hypothetical protein
MISSTFSEIIEFSIAWVIIKFICYEQLPRSVVRYSAVFVILMLAVGFVLE